MAPDMRGALNITVGHPSAESGPLRRERRTEELPRSTEMLLDRPSAAWPALPIAVATLTVTFLWAYWSTLEQLVTVWNNQPDYSHGFLVPVLAALFLWAARDRFPGFASRLAWPGVALLGVRIALRVIAGYY